MTAQVAARLIGRAALVAVINGGLAVTAADARQLGGRWDAAVEVNGVEVPFPFEIVDNAGTLSGSFFNGERRVTSTSASVSGQEVSFRFGQYGSTLQARLDNGRLVGEYR